MNQIFHDQRQRKFIKIFADKKLLSAELSGALVFSKIVLVPQIKALDTKTALITQVSGISATRFPDEFIVKKTLELFQKTGKLTRSGLIPIHGDLQKQNMFFNLSGKLILIDFEHFGFGTLEDELANNFFHNDSNCLPIVPIARKLLYENKISITNLIQAVGRYAQKRNTKSYGSLATKLLQLS